MSIKLYSRNVMVPSSGVVFTMFTRKDPMNAPSCRIHNVMSRIYHAAFKWNLWSHDVKSCTEKAWRSSGILTRIALLGNSSMDAKDLLFFWFSMWKWYFMTLWLNATRIDKRWDNRGDYT